MKKSSSFDPLISHIVFIIDYIFEDDDSPQALKNYLYLIALGMVLNYGDEYIDDIYTTIRETKFNIIKNEHNYSDNLFYRNCIDNRCLFKGLDFTQGISSLKYLYNLKIENFTDDSIKTLELLAYQLNYILFNRKRKIPLGENIKIRIDYLRNSLMPEKTIAELTLNKIFNALQTEDIIKNILRLRNEEIKNEKFTNALKMVSNIDFETYKIEGLDSLVNLFRPLYGIDEIKKIVNSYDNDKLLEKEFDSILGKNTYKKICFKLELLNSMIRQCEKGINHNYYEVSLEYVNIRNDFINKYIKIKCT